MQRSLSPAWLMALVLAATVPAAAPAHARVPQQAATATQNVYKPGVPFTPQQINTLLPQTVYFQGRMAPLQLRNAGGMLFAGDQIVWVSLVDSSGYATSIQERYQFYLVTEGSLRVNGTVLKAGAYGRGFVGDRCLIMDLGGHTVAEGPVQTDTALARPRPLQWQADGASAARLLLGRRSIKLEVVPK